MTNTRTNPASLAPDEKDTSSTDPVLTATQGEANSDTATNNTDPSSNDPWADRYSNLRSHTQKQLNEKDAKLKELEAKLFEKEKAKLPSSQADIDALAQENPKLVEAMMRIAQENTLSTRADLQKDLDQVKDLQRQLQLEEGFKQVLEKHPDAKTIRDSADFRAWLDSQPDDVRSIPFNNLASPQMISLLIDNYKADLGSQSNAESAKQASKQTSIDNSKSVKSGSNVDVGTGNDAILYAEALKKFTIKDKKSPKYGKPDWDKIRELAANKQLIM